MSSSIGVETRWYSTILPAAKRLSRRYPLFIAFLYTKRFTVLFFIITRLFNLLKNAFRLIHRYPCVHRNLSATVSTNDTRSVRFQIRKSPTAALSRGSDHSPRLRRACWRDLIVGFDRFTTVNIFQSNLFVFAVPLISRTNTVVFVMNWSRRIGIAPPPWIARETRCEGRRPIGNRRKSIIILLFFKDFCFFFFSTSFCFLKSKRYWIIDAYEMNKISLHLPRCRDKSIIQKHYTAAAINYLRYYYVFKTAVLVARSIHGAIISSWTGEEIIYAKTSSSGAITGLVGVAIAPLTFNLAPKSPFQIIEIV